jgi:hypothetical protein
MFYRVYCDGRGTIHTGNEKQDAQKSFEEAVNRSKNDQSCGFFGESVTLYEAIDARSFESPVKNYEGHLQNPER